MKIIQFFFVPNVAQMCQFLMEVYVSYTVCSELTGLEILFPTLHCGPYSCMKTIFLGKIHTCGVE